MRITLLCGLVVAMASTAPAAVVTYRMSYHDNGAGAFAENNWAIYASVSPDAAGLVQYGINLLPYTSGGAFLNRANGVVMSHPDTGETRSLGFVAGRSKDGLNGILTGRHDLEAVGFIPVYGMGQQPDDLDNYLPAGFTTQDAALGGARSRYGQQIVDGRNLFLISRGTWSGPVLPAFDTTSPEMIGVVWNSRSGLETSNASLVFDYANLVPEPAGLCSLFALASLLLRRRRQ